jgi:hypothetical protein
MIVRSGETKMRPQDAVRRFKLARGRQRTPHPSKQTPSPREFPRGWVRYWERMANRVELARVDAAVGEAQ